MANKNVIFVLANIGVGVLNYFFQVAAAKSLSTTEYGAFNVWNATLSVFLVFASVFQFYGTLTHYSYKKLSLVTFGSALLLIMLSAYGVPDPYFVIVVTVFFSGVFSFAYGSLMAHFFFLQAGVLALVMTATKVLYPYFVVTDLRFYHAIMTAPVVGLLLSTLFLFRLRPQETNSVAKGTLLPSFILALMAALIPQLDILITQAHASEVATGHFGYVSLISKAFFFILMIGSQLLLPYQARSGESILALKKYFILPILGLIVGLFASFLGPQVLASVLGKDVSIEPLWVILSCFNVSVLGTLYLLIQESVAKKSIKVPALYVGLLIFEFIIYRQLTLTLGSSLMLSATTNFALLLSYSFLAFRVRK